MEGETRTVVRVRYPETDRMGVVYHANYLVWFELGRTELMRERGCSYAELEDRRKIFFPVVKAGATYRRPVHYDDELEVLTRLTAVGGARVKFAYRVVPRGGDETVAQGFTEHAAVGQHGKPVRLPGDLRARLQQGGAGR